VTVTLPGPRPTSSRPLPAGPGGGLLGPLDDRRRALAGVGPNWFATVMGTSIVATAAVDLPVQVPGQRVFAQVVWVLAGLLLAVVGAATVGHWVRFPDRARGHAADPVMVHFYGAVPMALLAFGAATLAVGVDLIGAGAAVGVDWVLWLLGTVLGLACAVAVPYLVFTRHDVPEDGAFGGWLMPVVPPMVSAATGAALIPHAPAGQLRQTLLDCCYAMFGISLLASIVVVTLLWGRLARFKVGAAAAVPTLWIVLGPLGQSVTAANALGAQAPGVLAAPYAAAARALGLIYGLPVWGFAMMWAALAIAITVRTARRGLPFSLTWWSFTFPVGTVVTGTSALAITTGTDLFRVAAAVFFIGLLAAWITVAARTAYGTWTGELLR
jgi:C4-dicarboxylate transporter/malic acid transport protein